MKNILLLLPVIALTLFAAENKLIQKDFFNTELNWSSSYLESFITETIPPVIFDSDDPEYENEDSAHNVTQARDIAMEKGKKRLNTSIYRSLEKLILNAEERIQDRVELDESFREKYNMLFQTDSLSYSVKYIKNRVHIAGKFFFFGERGLVNYLAIEYPAKEFPLFEEMDLAPQYTGLVIDARHLAAKPALFPKIFSDNGLEIYSSRFVDKNAAISRGLVSYLTEPLQTLKQKKAGENPLYVVALSSKGKHQTDLVIPATEARKLLASGITRKALQKCKVVILLKP